MKQDHSFDYLFAGGGLASGLAAYRLAMQHPDVRIGIVEAEDQLGGNHTWSLHTTDISIDATDWIQPFVAYSWADQQVSFPERHRHLTTGYCSITADRFQSVLRNVPNVEILTGCTVTDATANALTLGPDRTLNAKVVLDGRGPQSTPHLKLAFQKFLGREVRFDKPHGLKTPIIMDATVPQKDGYRFVYVLPFTDDTALIEDTYYAEGHDLSHDVLRTEIDAYAVSKGWRIVDVIREEHGILPITLDGDVAGFWRDLENGPAPIGLRAGLFHPVTGYSVPDAVRVAERLCSSDVTDTPSAFAAIRDYSHKRWKRHGFYRLLNRLLFQAARPEERYIVLRRFYGLPELLIRRFYEGENSFADRVRILAGKPPVPLGAALKALPAQRRGRPIDEGVLG